MNEDQLRAFQDLPQAESCRRIDFDGAEIVTLQSDPPQYVLAVSGTKPYLTMEITLVPLLFVRRPDYWGIEVVGRLSGVALPVQAPYSVSIPLVGITGSEGVEVLGATRSQRLEVPPGSMPLGDCRGWRAWLNLEPPGKPRLHVRGECEFPAAGYAVELSRHEPQGANPRDLLLVRVVHEPPGRPIAMPTIEPVQYTEETEAGYDTVTILTDGVSFAVREVV